MRIAVAATSFDSADTLPVAPVSPVTPGTEIPAPVIPLVPINPGTPTLPVVPDTEATLPLGPTDSVVKVVAQQPVVHTTTRAPEQAQQYTNRPQLARTGGEVQTMLAGAGILAGLGSVLVAMKSRMRREN